MANSESEHPEELSTTGSSLSSESGKDAPSSGETDCNTAISDEELDDLVAQMEQERSYIADLARNCGCDSAIGYDCDNVVRHLQLDCKYVNYLNNDTRTLEEKIDEILKSLEEEEQKNE